MTDTIGAHCFHIGISFQYERFNCILRNATCSRNEVKMVNCKTKAQFHKQGLVQE